MMAQHSQGYSAKGLSCKINMHIIQDCFVVEEGVLTMSCIFFIMGEMMVLQKV